MDNDTSRIFISYRGRRRGVWTGNRYKFASLLVALDRAVGDPSCLQPEQHPTKDARSHLATHITKIIQICYSSTLSARETFSGQNKATQKQYVERCNLLWANLYRTSHNVKDALLSHPLVLFSKPDFLEKQEPTLVPKQYVYRNVYTIFFHRYCYRRHEHPRRRENRV